MTVQTPLLERIGNLGWSMAKDLYNLVTFIGEVASATIEALRQPRKIRWNDVLHYMDKCGADALPIAALICFAMGLILGFQGYTQLHKFGQDIFLAATVVLVITAELGPLMVAIICIGRAGSAFAAEIGTMKVNEEIDALTTMGFKPSRFLVVPKLIAMVAVMPMLTIYGTLAGIIGGMFVGVMLAGTPPQTYIQQTLNNIYMIYIWQGLVKSVVFGLVITVIGCWRGFEAPGDAQGVGAAATSAVVTGIFWCIIADTLLTVFFTAIG